MTTGREIDKLTSILIQNLLDEHVIRKVISEDILGYIFIKK